MVLSLSDSPTSPFFFPSSGAPKGAPLQGRRKECIFFGGGSGERVIEAVTYHSTKLSGGLNAVQLGGGPEGQGERHS